MVASINQFLGDDFVMIAGRVLTALVLSGLIGFEREMKNQSAGFRTHILVGISACLMMTLSLYGFEQYIDKYLGVANISFDPSRIPAYVISGIGFLGAGTIIVSGGTIRGLTTAASIWAVAGLGLIVGIGMYGIAIFTTAIILLSLSLLNNVEKKFIKARPSSVVEVIVMPELEISKLVSRFEAMHIPIKSVEIEVIANDLRRISMKLEQSAIVDRFALFEDLAKIEHVKHVSDMNQK